MTLMAARSADSWADRWTKSTFKQASGEAGDWVLTPGKFYGDAEINKGIKTTPDARFYAISSEMSEKFDNKDKDLVLQVSAGRADPPLLVGPGGMAAPRAYRRPPGPGGRKQILVASPQRCPALS